MASTNLEMAAYMCRVPEKAIPDGAIVLTSFISPETGKSAMQYLFLGDMTVAQAVGMLEMVKNELLHQ